MKWFTFPKGRISHAVCLDGDFKDRMYIHGGSAANVGQESLSDLWVFNFTTLIFHEIKVGKSQSPPAMYGHSLSYHSNALYLYGGTTGFQFFKAFWRFDLASNTWSPVVISSGVGVTKVN